MNDTIPIKHLLDVAKETARMAGVLLTKEYRSAFRDGNELAVAEKTSPQDLVTAVDGRTQAAIIEHIRTHFPDHRFIAEEKGADALGSPDCPYEWIIDPLDGTTNFTRARKNFGSIIAVQKAGVFLAGATVIPLAQQFFYGAKGWGAFVNDQPVTLRATRDLRHAVLNSNGIRRGIEGPDGVYYIPSPYCASLQNTGSAADEIGLLLTGHTDGVFFDGVGLWDIAAGFLMIGEAGGKMRYEYKEPGNVRGGLRAVASTAPIFEELCEFTFEKLPKIRKLEARI